MRSLQSPFNWTEVVRVIVAASFCILSIGVIVSLSIRAANIDHGKDSSPIPIGISSLSINSSSRWK